MSEHSKNESEPQSSELATLGYSLTVPLGLLAVVPITVWTYQAASVDDIVTTISPSKIIALGGAWANASDTHLASNTTGP